MKSSERAFNLIVSEEDGDQVYYQRHCEHFEWPAGASGPTVMIGYDCGYVTRAEASADCVGILPAEMMPRVLAACGLKGAAAHAFVRDHGTSVTITWDQAMAEFSAREIPKWEKRLDAALPNAELLAPDSYGAMLSMVYNRGCSFDEPGPHYAEMRAIKALMVAKAFDQIPAELLSMRRLWPVGGDLWRRRAHEADLFRAGLGLNTLAPLPAAPVRRTCDRSVRALQGRLNAVLRIEPPLACDGVAGDATRAAVRAFQGARGMPVDGIPGRDTWAALERLNPA